MPPQVQTLSLTPENASGESESFAKRTSTHETSRRSRGVEESVPSLEEKKRIWSPPSILKDHEATRKRLRFSLIVVGMASSIFLVAVDRGIVAIAMYLRHSFLSH